MSSHLLIYIDLFRRGLYDSVRNSFHILSIDEDFSKSSSTKTSTKQYPHQPRLKKSTSSSSSPVKANLALLCLFNGGILLVGMLGFHYLFLPTFGRIFNVLAGVDSTSTSKPFMLIQRILIYTFNFLWLIPAFIISKFVNAFWFRDIADVVLQKLTKRPRSASPPSFALSISDILFSLVVQICFLIQSTIILLIPVPGVSTIFGNICLCLLYSFYAFEYAWIYCGLTVKERVERIESHWPYYLGFGLPLTVLSTLIFTSVIVNECIFSILFPFAIVAATSVDFDQRVNLKSTETSITSLNVFALCIRITSRLFSLVKKTTPGVAAKN